MALIISAFTESRKFKEDELREGSEEVGELELEGSGDRFSRS
jgi:hypothetical protein